MGGNAFAKHTTPVLVPRLSPALYQSLCDQYLALLSAVYQRVASPTAAPGKLSHGDIDLLVATPTTAAISAYLSHRGLISCCPDLPEHVHAAKHILNAQYLVYTASNPITTFAAPHPVNADAFVQVDVTLCPETTFDWQRCLSSHGDFWLMVSRACMSLGLSFTDSGVHLRDEIIEKHEWSKKFLVGASPDTILDFLDLNVDTFWQDKGFESREVMFDHLRNMRFFTLQTFVTTEDRALTSTERKKLATRGDYRAFCEEYVPRLTGVRAPMEMTRKEVQDELVALFGRQEAWNGFKASWWRQFWETRAKQLVNLLRREMLQEKAREEGAYADAWTGFLAQTCE